MEPEAAGGLRLDDSQRRAWLRLIRTENVGPVTFRMLINRFGSAETALEMLPELARRGGARQVRIPHEEEIDAELDAGRRMGAQFIVIGEAHYPPLLARVDNPPPLVAAKGNLDLLRQPMLAVVGARNASLAAIKFAQRLALEIGRAGYVIASGLARGIDAAAHQGSLDTGTVAVLAGGLDRPYPPENDALFRAIGERGVVLTEMPFGWVPRARDFPRRNRIVAGLSYGLLVVEAANRSGSLISARLANEMGRLVFAIPGSPLDPRAAGTNRLLKEGAILVTEADDILSALAPVVGAAIPGPHALEAPPDLSAAPEPGDRERALVLEALGPVPVGVDEIIHHTELAPAQVFLILLELDLAGRLERHPGGSVSLLPAGS
ncbi:DNA-processing protein DprA [Chelativorans sp. AA-79]|uniref:DNA-processing protein DprA n=1 Tax=Chelativorans sp. AA-79 TaxID=3028735 RepID=UPI0023F6B2B3|nr:DNA-processing protein DprA [Chelativorans sp. AA-79]WEX11717.1 DNA-processing protein DprA [Chelativorans sp. AA-79]